MSQQAEDREVADWIAALGTAAQVIGTAAGRPVIGQSVAAALHATADLMRLRKLSTRELVDGLQFARDLHMPWGAKP